MCCWFGFGGALDPIDAWLWERCARLRRNEQRRIYIPRADASGVVRGQSVIEHTPKKNALWRYAARFDNIIYRLCKSILSHKRISRSAPQCVDCPKINEVRDRSVRDITTLHYMYEKHDEEMSPRNKNGRAKGSPHQPINLINQVISIRIDSEI